MLKKSLFTIVFILSIFCLGGCDMEEQKDDIKEEVITVTFENITSEYLTIVLYHLYNGKYYPLGSINFLNENILNRNFVKNSEYILYIFKTSEFRNFTKDNIDKITDINFVDTSNVYEYKKVLYEDKELNYILKKDGDDKIIMTESL